MKRWVVAMLVLTLARCSFPKAETKYEGKVMRDRGMLGQGNRLEEQAKTKPAVQIGDREPPDAYHFPDLQVPPEKRNYSIHFSSPTSVSSTTAAH